MCAVLDNESIIKRSGLNGFGRAIKGVGDLDGDGYSELIQRLERRKRLTLTTHFKVKLRSSQVREGLDRPLGGRSGYPRGGSIWGRRGSLGVQAHLPSRPLKGQVAYFA